MKFNKTGLYVAAFFAMFLFFMVWYFLICADISVAPSDWALVAIAVVTAVECIVAAWIKTRGSGGLTEAEKDGIKFGANVIASALNIEAPFMQSSAVGDEDDEDEEVS